MRADEPILLGSLGCLGKQAPGGLTRPHRVTAARRSSIREERSREGACRVDALRLCAAGRRKALPGRTASPPPAVLHRARTRLSRSACRCPEPSRHPKDYSISINDSIRAVSASEGAMQADLHCRRSTHRRGSLTLRVIDFISRSRPVSPHMPEQPGDTCSPFGIWEHRYRKPVIQRGPYIEVRST